MANCSNCGAELTEGHAFCEKCGQQLQEGVERKKVRRRLGSLAGAQHRKHIKSARTAIMVVAVLTFLGGVLVWYLGNSQFDNEIEKARRDSTVVVDEQAVAKARAEIQSVLKLLMGVNFVLGAVFVGLFFWAKSNPFGASLTALVIYLTSMAVNAAIDPATLAQGWLVKIFVIAALVSGVKSGLAFKKVKQDNLATA